MKEKHLCALGGRGEGGGRVGVPCKFNGEAGRKVRMKPLGLKTGDQSGKITLEMGGQNNYKEFSLCKCFSRCLRAKYIYN